MLIVPIESPDHTEDAVLVVLDDENLARMAKADPAEVKLRETGRHLVNPLVVICHEKPSPELQRAIQTRDLKKIIAFLQRGWEFRPDKGDSDNPPHSIGSQQ